MLQHKTNYPTQAEILILIYKDKLVLKLEKYFLKFLKIYSFYLLGLTYTTLGFKLFIKHVLKFRSSLF